MSRTERDLTVERLREVLFYCPYTGIFIWRVSQSRNIKPGMLAGTPKDGYRRIRIDWKFYRTNRLAWLYMTGEWPENEINHDDRNKQNDRWDNLFDVTHRTNCNNRNV